MGLRSLSNDRISMGWVTSARTLITSPLEIVAGRRILTLPISASASAMAILLSCSSAPWLPSAATYGDLHFPLHHVQRAMVHLDNRPEIGGLRQADVSRNSGLPSLGSQGE